MAGMEVKSVARPDETRTFEKGKVELVSVGGRLVGMATFQPGWRWSSHVKPIAKTASCQAPHLQYHLSGMLHVRMDDGTEREIGPSEVSHIPPGHDAWVVGNVPVVMIDSQGYAQPAKK